MTIDEDVRMLLAARAIQPRSVSRLTAGQKNITSLVESTAGDRYVVRRYTTARAAEVDYELAAVEYLSARGFPTPAPVRAGDGNLAGQLGTQPAAVFQFASGSHPADLGTAFRQDLELGLRAVALAGKLHHLTWGMSFPGHRTGQLDPLRRIDDFLTGPLATLAVLAEATKALARLSTTLTELYSASMLPRGLVHNDISAHNLLLDSAKSVTALIDFDDCMSTFLLYYLGRIVEVWGSTPDGHIDPERISQLIDAYSHERTLTTEEKRNANSLIAAYAAATGIRYLTGKVRQGETLTSPADSTAMSLALQMLGPDANG
jgi:Ser/Thr protein kinase RdoA (MazF antagonist)